MSDLFASVVKHSIDMAVPIAQKDSKDRMLVGVIFSRPALDSYNRGSHAVNAASPVPYYAGVARMYSVSGSTTYDLGDEPQYFGTSYVSIPITVNRPRINDDVEITDHKDPTLVGRHYRVTDVDSGGTVPAVHRCAVVGAEPAPGTSL